MFLSGTSVLSPTTYHLCYWKILNICPILLWDIGMLFVLVFQVFPKPDWVSKLTECYLSETVKMLRVGQFKPKSSLFLSLLSGSSHRHTHTHHSTWLYCILHSCRIYFHFSPTLSYTISFVPFFLPTLISEFHRDMSVAFCHMHRNAHRSEFGRPELQNQSVNWPASFTRLWG